MQHPTQAATHDLTAWFATLNQSQVMSHAKFVFLIALVIFFIVLFVVAYVWMRRPDFGQRSGRQAAGAPGTTDRPGGDGHPSEASSEREPAVIGARGMFGAGRVLGGIETPESGTQLAR